MQPNFFLVFLVAGLALSIPVHAQTCGNGIREGAEQCDDGNRASFDGCSARCMFEQVHRINQLKMQFAADTNCTANALGGAFLGLMQSQIQAATDASIAAGSTSVLLYFSGLGDLSGIADPDGLQIGLLDATPENGALYDGTNDVDWWYQIVESELDPPQTPAALLGANMVATTFSAGPGAFTLTTPMLGAPLSLTTTSLRISALTGDVTTPMAWVDGTVRGHLPGENLDLSLQSFSTTGTGQSGPVGTWCGNASARSFAVALLPLSITSYCTNYTVSNTMLDLIVGGCTYLSFTLVKKTQPDQGGGDVYEFTTNSQTHDVTGCKKNNSAATLSDCLDAAAYSYYYRFSSDRVIARSSGAADFIFYDDFD